MLLRNGALRRAVLAQFVAHPERVEPSRAGVVLRTCGHLAMWDDPDQVAALLLSRR